VNASEAIESFPCFGSTVTVYVVGAGPAGDQAQAAARAKSRLLEWHRQFSRFEPDSEISKLNADARETVPVSPVMARLIQATLEAARMSGGLVDGTLVSELEGAGYAEHFDVAPLELPDVLQRAPARAPAAPSPSGRWKEVSLDPLAGTVTRPLGLRFDSGGVAKGLFADILAGLFAMHPGYAIDSGGDLRLGGTAGVERPVRVANPFDKTILHTFALPAHHLLDPATGRPAFTGIVQVTALAPTAVEAETLAKATLLRGPGDCTATLRHGGVVLYDDQSFDVMYDESLVRRRKG
jgi:thiamine biosynthesis lipoprotein